MGILSIDLGKGSLTFTVVALWKFNIDLALLNHS